MDDTLRYLPHYRRAGGSLTVINRSLAPQPTIVRHVDFTILVIHRARSDKPSVQEKRENRMKTIQEELTELDMLRVQCARFREALERIAQRKGPYNRDELTFARNVIESMSSLADAALAAQPNDVA